MGMNILWVSNSPFQPTGYGVVTEHMVSYLSKYTEHDIDVYCNSGQVNTEPIEWRNGTTLYSRSQYSKQRQDKGYSDVCYLWKKQDYDLVLIAYDAWSMHQYINESTPFRYAVYTPIDHESLGTPWQTVCEHAEGLVPYTAFAYERIHEAGYSDKCVDPVYHGVDTNTYNTQVDASKQDLGFDQDQFVAVMAKANSGSRPKYPRQLAAVNEFVDALDLSPDEFGLYIHADRVPSGRGENLREVVEVHGLTEYVRFADPFNYRLNTITPEQMARMYAAGDVLLNAVACEGFGLPILEAMACGTPPIFHDSSAMTEVAAGTGFAVGSVTEEYSPRKQAYRKVPDIADITEALIAAHEMYQEDSAEFQEMKTNAVQRAHNLPWSKVAAEMTQRLESIGDNMAAGE